MSVNIITLYILDSTFGQFKLNSMSFLFPFLFVVVSAQGLIAKDKTGN